MTLGGRSASVVDLIHGPEELPLVYITVQVFDGKKMKRLTVALTEKHPVLVRYNYLVQASWVDIHDSVHTMWGPGLVVDVKRKIAKQEVWNLVLSDDQFLETNVYSDLALRYAFSSNSLLGLPPRDHIVFAHGIALATWPLQSQLAAALKNGMNLNLFS